MRIASVNRNAPDAHRRAVQRLSRMLVCRNHWLEEARMTRCSVGLSATRTPPRSGVRGSRPDYSLQVGFGSAMARHEMCPRFPSLGSAAVAREPRRELGSGEGSFLPLRTASHRPLRNGRGRASWEVCPNCRTSRLTLPALEPARDGGCRSNGSAGEPVLLRTTTPGAFGSRGKNVRNCGDGKAHRHRPGWDLWLVLT